MRKLLLLMLIIASPIIGQEKEVRREYYKRPIFGLNFNIGYSYNLLSYSGLNVGISPEFYLGTKRKIYFYLQLPLGYQYYSHKSDEGALFIQPAPSMFYFGALIGLGGYILEADRSNQLSIIMNGAFGGHLLFGPTEAGQGYNGTSTALGGAGVMAYLDLLFRYHQNEIYAIQFGPALIVNFMIPSITVDLSFRVGLAF